MFSLHSAFGEGSSSLFGETDFQLLMLVGMIHPLGTGLLSPILDSLIEPFGASAANIGLMVSVFLMPAIVVIPVVGALADHYGRKRILTGSLLLFGVTGTAISFTTDFRVALALRLVQGIGWAGLVPVVVTSIGDLYAGTAETTVQGFRQAASGVVGGVLSVAAGLIVTVAWHYPFLLYALSIPVAVMVYLWFEEPTAVDGGTENEDADRNYWGALASLLGHRRVLAIILARFVPYGVFAGFTAYNSIIVVQLLGGTPAQAGGLFALMSLTVAVAATQAGRIEARVGTWDRPLVGANVCMGAGFGLVVLAPSIVVAGVGAVLIGAGVGTSGPLYRNLITGFAPPSFRGGLVSIGAAGSRLMGALTPVVMGGIIALGTPLVGFTSALQLASFGVVVAGSGIGLLCVVVASASSPIA